MTKIDTSVTSWDFSKLYRSLDDPQIMKDREIGEKKIDAFVAKWKDRTDYLEDPKVLKEALDESSVLSEEMALPYKEYYYTLLLEDLDQSNAELKARSSKIIQYLEQLQQKTLFFSHKISLISAQKHEQFLTYPDLKPYRYKLKNLFEQGKYALSEPEEKLMMLKAQSAKSKWVEMVQKLITKSERSIVVDGKEEIKTFEEILSLFDHKDKSTRDAAALEFNDILSSVVDVAEAEVNAIIHDKKVNDELRGFDRPDASRYLAEDVSAEMVDSLLAAVDKYKPVAHRYYALKAKLLGLDKLAYHERNMEYGSTDMSISYEEVVAMTQKVMASLDSEFEQIFKQFVEQGHIDVFPKKGKRSGACCYHIHKKLPIYILLNYTDKLERTRHLAHECGHGIHNEMMRAQPNHYYSTPVATAEVASNFFENYIVDLLLQEASDEERLSLLVKDLNSIVSSIYRQSTCMQFEQELHAQIREKGYLGKKEIGELFTKHMVSYMGDAVEQSPGSENWWVYWSHIRMFFYTYSYASGLIIARVLHKKVREDPSYVTKVKEFMAAGASDSPANIFKRIGLDITTQSFWEEGLKETERMLDEAEALAKKLGKI